MIRGKNPAFDVAHSTVHFNVAVLGAGAAAPTLPADGPMTAAVSTFPLAINGLSRVAAEIPTRTSAGLYVLTIQHQLVNVLPDNTAVVAAGGAPTQYLTADIVSIVPATRKITVLVQNTATGAAADLGTSDLLVVSLKGIDTSSPA